MTERMCYVLTAQERHDADNWVCCVFDTESDAVAARAASEADSGGSLIYEVSLVPFHSQTDT